MKFYLKILILVVIILVGKLDRENLFSAQKPDNVHYLPVYAPDTHNHLLTKPFKPTAPKVLVHLEY